MHTVDKTTLKFFKMHQNIKTFCSISPLSLVPVSTI